MSFEEDASDDSSHHENIKQLITKHAQSWPCHASLLLGKGDFMLKILQILKSLCVHLSSAVAHVWCPGSLASYTKSSLLARGQPEPIFYSISFFFRIILEPISFSQRSSENSLDMLFVWSQPEHEVWIVQMEITEQNGHVGLSEHFLEDTLET